MKILCRSLVLVVLFFNFWAEAATTKNMTSNTKIESSLLCHKDSGLCAIWWKFESPKATTFWRNHRSRDTNLGSVTLNRKTFEQQASFLNSLLQTRKPAKVCLNQFIYIQKVSSSRTICEDSLSLSDKEQLHSFFSKTVRR